MAKNEATIQNLFDLIQDFDLELTPEVATKIVANAYITNYYFINSERLNAYRLLDKGITNEMELKQLLDPKGRDNSERDMISGEFYNTDWTPCPLVQSLNRITKGYIIDSVSDVKVDGIDRLSVEKKIKKRQQEISKRYAVDLINFLNSQTGDMPISYNTDLEKLTDKDKEVSEIDTTANLLEQIKGELDNDMDFALLADVGALKDGVELAHEIMIKYYLEHLNFEQRVSQDIVSDIMKIRTFSYRFYTSAMDGTPQVAYIDPISIRCSPFKEKDARDMDYWFNEFTVTWADYMKMIGGKLSKEKNKAIYEANRITFYPLDRNYLAWDDSVQFYNSIINTNIRLGYFECKKHVHDKVTDKYYDVWKKFYYLPILGNSLSLDPEYILDLGDVQDMHREGGQLQYAKPTLIMFRDNSVASWYDIQKPDLLRLNILYNQYLNTATSIIPRGVQFAEETLTELVNDMLNAQREYLNEQGQEMTNESGVYQRLLSQTLRKFNARGKSIFKRKAGDNNEKQLDPPTFQINHSLYDDLTNLINQMMSIYNMMITSLGTNPILLGQAPKQHQTLKGIEIANQSGLSMLQEMIKINEFSVTEFGSRMIYYDKLVSKEFDKTFEPKSARASQMKAVIGTYGVGWLEIYKDMYVQDCTMKVEMKSTEEQRIMLFDYTSQLELQGKLPIGTSLMVQEIQNYKLAKLYVLAQVRKAERIAVENQMALMEQQQIAQQQAQAQQFQMAQQDKASTAEIEARLLQLENQMKQEGMSQNIAERGANKEKENQQKAELKAQQEILDKQLSGY